MEQKILILGAKGMLGGELKRIFPSAYAWDREDADVTDVENLKFKIKNLKLKPTAIINCVAFNDVDGAEENREIAFRLNAEVLGSLANICKELAIPLVHFSTNYVFDGVAGEYKESAEPHPLSVYGESKYAGEQVLREACEKYYLIRTAVLFGPQGASELSKKSFIDIMLELAETQGTIKAVENEVNSVTFVRDLAKNVKMLLEEGYAPGIYHVTNSGQASWYDLAKEIFAIKNKHINLIPVSSSEFPRKAPRPKKSALINTKLPPIRSWQEALNEFLISNL